MLGGTSIRDLEETPTEEENAEDAPVSGRSRAMRSSSKVATAGEDDDQVQYSQDSKTKRFRNLDGRKLFKWWMVRILTTIPNLNTKIRISNGSVFEKF